MTVIVLGGTGIGKIVPVAGLPVAGLPVAGLPVAGLPVAGLPMLGADSARPTGPIHDDVSHTGTCVALGLRALGVPVAVADTIGDDDAGRRLHDLHRPARLGRRESLPPRLRARRRRGLRQRRATAGRRGRPHPEGRRGDTRAGHRRREGRDPVQAGRAGSRKPPGRPPAGEAISRPAGEASSRPAGEVSPDPVGEVSPSPVGGVSPGPVGGVSPAPVGGVGPRPVGEVGPRPAGEASSRPASEQPAGGVSLRPAGEQPAGEQPAGGVSSRHQPAADPGGPVVDTNGAGDAFAAAFLAAWLTGASDDDCLRWASLAGAFACTRAVGADCFITRETLLDRLG